MTTTKLQVPLPDGRSLEVLDQGLKVGTPVIYLHGAPGSNKDHIRHADYYVKQQIRMVSVNRPGTGASTTSKNWSAIGFADDLRAVMDQLDIEKATVIGFSAGGLYACAYAYCYPERINKLGLLASVGPFDIPSLHAKLADAIQLFHETAIKNPEGLLQQLSDITTPEAMFELMLSLVSAPDKHLLKTPEIRNSLLPTFADVLEQGMENIIKEVYNTAMPWGFSASDIPVDTRIWHGTADSNTPIACSKYLAARIPRAQATYIDGAGHYFSFEMWPEILQTILRRN